MAPSRRAYNRGPERPCAGGTKLAVAGRAGLHHNEWVMLEAGAARVAPGGSGRWRGLGTRVGKKGQRQRRLILDSLLLGLAGAAAAQVFTFLLRWASDLFLGRIGGYTPPGLPGEGGILQQVTGPHGLWLIPVSTTLGGLLVGVLITWLAPEAEGHGTDTAVKAFHRENGFLRGRVAPVKAVASAITIGSGGAAGREGPIALIAAGVGSWYADITKRDDEERRLLLTVGMAAGLSAIFRSPVGTALFAIEVLYSEMEFEFGALIYTMLASIVAYAVNGLFTGWQPLFHFPAYTGLPHVYDYGWYIVLGVACGLMATLVPVIFYGARDGFRRLPVPVWLKPGIGGLLLGLMALLYPEILGGGYGWVQKAIDGQLVMGTLAVLVFAKMVAMALSVSSGGSGGVFAPTLFAGAMLGALLADVFHQPPGPMAVVGMAALFSGAANVPLATLMMVTEMTGGYTLLVPAALAVFISYLIHFWLSSRVPYPSLYEAQVATRADSPALHTEHLNIALRLMERRGLLNPEEVGSLNLLSLLRSGIPVTLPGGRHMTVGVVREDSSLAGRTVADAMGEVGSEAELIGLLRGERMRPPRGETLLEPGDRLILLATDAVGERLEKELDRW